MTTPADPAITLNPHIAALPAYNAGLALSVAREISGRDDIARLASNENPDGCSPKVMEALRSARFEPWRYADPACADLRTALSAKLAVAADRIVVGNGSEEMIAAVSRAVLTPGSEVLTVVPSFGLHEIEPLAMGARVRKIAMTPDLEFDLPAIADALAAGPKLFFLSSPSNPVGPALRPDELTRLVQAVRPGTLFVLDEAYFEFADADTADGLGVLRESGLPFVVLRTFSKAYGLAGLRVGYAVASDAALARAVAAAKTPFNVNMAAQLAALAALEDEAWMRTSTARLRAERQRVAEALAAIGIRSARSNTNFLFFDCGRDSAAVARDLLQDGIIVKAWREEGYCDFVRATIGHAPDNDRLVESLARLGVRSRP